MATSQGSKIGANANPANIPQFNWGQLAVFFLLPVAWWLFLLYVITPSYCQPSLHRMVKWTVG